MSLIKTTANADQTEALNQVPIPNSKSVYKRSRYNFGFTSGLKRSFDSLILLIVMIGLWWGIETIDGKGIFFYFSKPSAVYLALISAMTSGYFWSNFWSTFEATLVAFVIGSLAGIIIGFAVTTVPRFERALEPFASMLNSLPRIALAPVFVVMLGISQSAKISVGASLVVFVLYYNTRAGMKSAQRDWLLMAETLGFNRWQIFVKIQGPAAWPSLFAGLRLGFTYGLLGVVSTEIIAARAGLGLLVETYSSELLMAKVYAVLIILAITAGLIYWVMGILEKRLMRWDVSNNK